MQALWIQRNAYFVSADNYLGCVSGQIEGRMTTMFQTNAPMDQSLTGLGQSHSDMSRERAMIHERYVRLCIAWEDRNGYGKVPCFES
jgi:hypothetical protein